MTQQKCIPMVTKRYILTRTLNTSTVLKNSKLETIHMHISSCTKCGIFTQWNAIQQWEWVIYNYMQEMDARHKHNVEQKKSGPKEHIMYDSIYLFKKKIKNAETTKMNLWFQNQDSDYSLKLRDSSG